MTPGPALVGLGASTIPQPPAPSLSQAWPELVVAGVLVLLGLRSAWKVTRVQVELDTLPEHALYALYVTARIGLWFVLAALFVGYGVVDDRQSLSWLVLLFIGLGAVQLLTSFFLGRTGPSVETTEGNNPTAEGNGRTMATKWVDPSPGPMEPEKHGETSEPGNPQPEAAEVESARVLANEARGALRQAGIQDEQIRRLADEFIALDRGEGLPEFIEWAKGRAGRS